MKPLRSLIFFFCSLVAFILLFYATSYSQPAAPTALAVVPRYTSPIVISVQWQDNSNNEDGFRIERREEGTAAWTFLTTVAATAGTGRREWVDNTATSDKMWEYHVCATSTALGNSAYTDVSRATSPRQVWPIHDGDHTILHTFGTPLNFSGNRYFHNGIDIGAGGKQVDAARGGIVTRVDNLAGGQLWLDVDFGAGPETDVYAHTIVDPTWGRGHFISPGERIGTVSTVYFNMDPQADHVHWGDGDRHNLIPYTKDIDRDPNMATPVVADINNDGRDFIIVPATANDHNHPRVPAWGDVDIIVDAYDDMSSGTNLMAAPYTIGYWIQSGVPGGDNVRNPTTPYQLIEFNFALHGPAPAHPLENAVVYWDLNADIQGNNTWQSCLSWIVTNTRGTDGATGNVDATQFWRTNARKSTGVEPNGSDAQLARENQEARFPDGTYYVHVVLEDLVHKTSNVRSVVIDNSRPYVKRVKVCSCAQPVYLAQWIWDAANAQLAIQPADFKFAAEFSALRTQDVTIEVEFSEPMQTASIESILPLGVTPTLISTQSTDARTIWKGLISNLDIADDGSDDGIHMITFNGTDIARNSLLQIHDRTNMGADHHNRDAGGAIRGTAGTDNIHGFRIGPEGPTSAIIPVVEYLLNVSP